MGYRSDVRIVTTKKGFKELKKFTDNYLKDRKYTYGNLLENLDINKETKYSKYFGWDSVKWYEGIEGFDDIDAIMKGLNYLADNNYSYRYARIGESYDDYEQLDYESDIEDEQDLEYPSLNRSFDDDYIFQIYDSQNNRKIKEQEK